MNGGAKIDDGDVSHAAIDGESPAGDCENHVLVRVGPLEDGFYFEDDGPRIPEDIRGTVFDHGVTTRDDGSGYGLSVVRTIVDAHGWDITAAESESGGARFEISGLEFTEFAD